MVNGHLKTLPLLCELPLEGGNELNMVALKRAVLVSIK